MIGRTHQALTLLAVSGGGLLATACRLPTDCASPAYPWLGRALALAAASAAGQAGNAIPDWDLRLLHAHPKVGRRVGHRAASHSLLVGLLVGLPVTAWLALLGFPACGCALILGFSAHVLADACAIGAGVQLAYPWRKRIKLLPRRFRVRRDHERRLRGVALGVALGLSLALLLIP